MLLCMTFMSVVFMFKIKRMFICEHRQEHISENHESRLSCELEINSLPEKSIDEI